MIKNPRIMPCHTFLWGYALQYNRGKDTFSLRQEPVLGMLAAGNSLESDTNRLAKQPAYPPMFFVPLKQHKDPRPENCIWSRVVDISSRYYAMMEDEARTGYNELIKTMQDDLMGKIGRLESMKL